MGGHGGPFGAAVTTRKSCASMARVVERCQEIQRRTWCSSSPVRPFADWKVSSTVQRRPATLTRVLNGTGRAE